MRSLRLTILLALAVPAAPLPAQAPHRRPDKELPPPPVLYRGLVPGRSTVAEVREALGQPLEEHRWYSYKLLYAAQGRPGLLDAVHLDSGNGKDGHLGCVEASTAPAGLETLDAVRARLGEPEWLLELHRQSIADYSEK